MRNWFIQHARALSFTLRRFFATPVASLLNVLVIGVALSLPAGLYVLLQNVHSLAEQMTGAPQISVFLAIDSSADDVARIGKKLDEHPGVARHEFVARAEALQQLKLSSGLADVIAGLNQNPLPDAYIVHPKQQGAQALEALRDDLQHWPKLAHVQLDSAWVRKLDALLGFGRKAVLILSALLGCALFAVTFNTIRLQILTRHDEIAVAQLIGATHVFIRRPFLYMGWMQGLLGGVAAILIVSLCMALLGSSLSGLTQLYSSSYTPQALSASANIALLLFSSAIGWLGAWISVSQYLGHTRLS